MSFFYLPDDLLNQIQNIIKATKSQICQEVLPGEIFIRNQLGMGKSVFDSHELTIDPQVYRKVLMTIAHTVLEYDRKTFSGLETIFFSDRLNEYGITKTVNQFLMHEKSSIVQLAANLEIDFQLLLILMNKSLSPWFQYISQLVAPHFNSSSWKNGYCPVCGNEPPLALQISKNERLLYCFLCMFQWCYPDKICPFCGNREREFFQILHSQSFPDKFCECCDICRKYLKIIVNETPLEPISAEALLFTTTDLDEIAQFEGYYKSNSYWC